MSGLQLNVTLDDVLSKAYLAELPDALADMDDLMDELAGQMESATLERFKTNIAPDGTPWEKSARAMRDGGQTLVDTGVNLRDTITSASDASSAQVGTSSPIAAIHQFGGKAGRNESVELPARPYIGLSDIDRGDAQDATLAYIREVSQ